VISTTGEMETGKIMVQGQSRKKVTNTHLNLQALHDGECLWSQLPGGIDRKRILLGRSCVKILDVIHT
jgi:hypothetical protein